MATRIIKNQAAASRTASKGRAGEGVSFALEQLRQLTPRDMDLLDILTKHWVLTAEQISRIAFTDVNTARKRLVLLHRRRILDRFRHGIRPGSEAWRYTLGPLGAVIMAARHGQSTPRPATHAERVLRLAESPRLEHLLGINEFFVSLIEHARTDARYSLRWWANEKEATAECAGLARPDGAGTWTRDLAGGHVHELTFFLEHDTGTESLARLTAKLPGYAEARLGGGPDCPVLFWLPSHRREANLQHMLRQRPTPVPVATAVRDGTNPAGDVWLIPGGMRRLHLVDLADALAATPDRTHPRIDEEAA